MHKTGRPVLVGTTSVEQSDSLSELLKEAEIPHEVRSLLFCYTITCKSILRPHLQRMHFLSLQRIKKKINHIFQGRLFRFLKRT